MSPCKESSQILFESGDFCAESMGSDEHTSTRDTNESRTWGGRASPDLLRELQLHLDLTATICKEHHNFICTFKA